MEEKITFVVPAYNAEATLGRTLESILHQTDSVSLICKRKSKYINSKCTNAEKYYRKIKECNRKEYQNGFIEGNHIWGETA